MTFLQRAIYYLKARFWSESGVRWGRLSGASFAALIAFLLLAILSLAAVESFRDRFNEVQKRVDMLEQKADCLPLHKEDFRAFDHFRYDVQGLLKNPALQVKIARKHQANLKMPRRVSGAGKTAVCDINAPLSFGKVENKFRIGPAPVLAEKLQRLNLQDTLWLTNLLRNPEARLSLYRELREKMEATKKGIAESETAAQQLPRNRAQQRALDLGRDVAFDVAIFFFCTALMASIGWIISLLLWLGKATGLTAAAKGWVAMGAGPIFVSLGLCLVLGLYLVTTASTIKKYQGQMELYHAKSESASKRFQKLAAERGLPTIGMIGTVVTKADKADPARLKKAQNEKRLIVADGGPLRWVGWLKDYPELETANAEEEQARKDSQAAYAILEDMKWLRNPVKWFLIACSCWTGFRFIMFPWAIRKRRVA